MRPVVFLSILLAVLSSVALAQSGGDEFSAVADRIEERREQLEAIEESMAENPPVARLLELRDEARALRRESELAAQPLSARLEVLGQDLRALGDPPAEGAPPEPDDIARQRAELLREQARVTALLRQADLNVAAADRVAAEVAEQRREAFTGALMARGPVLVSPAEWSRAAQTALEGLMTLKAAAGAWWLDKIESEHRDRTIISLLVAVGLAFAFLIPIRAQINLALRRRIAHLEPFASRRVLVAAVKTAAWVLPGVLGGLFLYEALRLNGAIPEEAEPLARSIWFGFIVLLFADGAVNAVFAPEPPAWRVAPLGTRSALAVRSLVLTAALVIVLDRVLVQGAKVFASSGSLVFVQEGMVAVTLGTLLFLLSRASLWRLEADGEAEAGPAEAAPPQGDALPPAAGVEQPSRFWPRVRLVGRLIGVVAALAALSGYVSFGHYLATRAFMLLALFGLIWALRALMREGVRLFDRNFTSSKNQAEDAEERLLYSWIGIGIDLLALAAFLPPALLILGAEWGDVRGWISDAFFGFSIGEVRISFAKILSGIVIFVLLLWITRAVQKTADTQLFPRSRIDKGVQNSLRTLIGYVGLVIALFAGVGALGFDLANLAIIAGALSVGIGFGLQSIVNNFVSGLILLFERPIKVGDWIVTGSGEGIVKRISVRSTEIETFDRSSVIVPNSELISAAVTNWTHKDRMGRLIIAVGVAYSSDAAQVVRILEDVGCRSRDVLSYPAPVVVFEDFGASSLDFTLRVYIRDVSDTLKVRTRLRIAIHERFKEEGIEIPFPQQDLYLRGVPEGFAGWKEKARAAENAE